MTLGRCGNPENQGITDGLCPRANKLSISSGKVETNYHMGSQQGLTDSCLRSKLGVAKRNSKGCQTRTQLENHYTLLQASLVSTGKPCTILQVRHSGSCLTGRLGLSGFFQSSSFLTRIFSRTPESQIQLFDISTWIN